MIEVQTVCAYNSLKKQENGKLRITKSEDFN
jgi:hypothetical protein